MSGSDNFTSDSLKNFLHAPKKKVDVDGIHRELERRRKMSNHGNENEPHVNMRPQDANNVIAADSAVRSNLAELVKILMNSGKINELETLLKEHHSFISDILKMISKTKKG